MSLQRIEVIYGLYTTNMFFLQKGFHLSNVLRFDLHLRCQPSPEQQAGRREVSFRRKYTKVVSHANIQ